MGRGEGEKMRKREGDKMRGWEDEKGGSM